MLVILLCHSLCINIRCPKTTVDPERGVKDGHEPLETLRKWGNDIITNLQITSVERIRYAFS